MARSDNPRKFRDSVLGQTHYDFVLKIMVLYPDYYTVECARNQRIRNANNLDRLLEGTMRKSSVSPLSRRDSSGQSVVEGVRVLSILSLVGARQVAHVEMY
jgi:hypothetical protein